MLDMSSSGVSCCQVFTKISSYGYYNHIESNDANFIVKRKK